MKKYLRKSAVICLAVMMFLVSTITVYAQNDNSSAGMTVKEYNGENYARVVGTPILYDTIAIDKYSSG